jgi:circadian clock protein KaiC
MAQEKTQGKTQIKKSIEEKAVEEMIKSTIKSQREPVKGMPSVPFTKRELKRIYIKTGIDGFDRLIHKGIPKGASVLICGGPGSGKTIFGLQVAHNAVEKGKKCLYMSFEESETRLRQHMEDFGWSWEHPEKKGLLVIKRFDPFRVTKSVKAMLEKAKGELVIGMEPLLFPKGFQPDIVIMDSLSAIAAAFIGKEESYRVYLEQLFRLFEKQGSTSFLITETEQIPKAVLTRSGVEEFLADGIIMMYNLHARDKGTERKHALEILKLRGVDHDERIVPIEIESGKGIIVFNQAAISI